MQLVEFTSFADDATAHTAVAFLRSHGLTAMAPKTDHTRSISRTSVGLETPLLVSSDDVAEAEALFARIRRGEFRRFPIDGASRNGLGAQLTRDLGLDAPAQSWWVRHAPVVAVGLLLVVAAMWAPISAFVESWL